MAQAQKKYNKRQNAYWDSIYKKGNPQQEHDWDFRNNVGPQDLLFMPRPLLQAVQGRSSKRYSVKEINFNSCDFFGDFSSIEIVFTKCRFSFVDFGGSVFKSAKFSECVFDACSLTLTEFHGCQFYGCTWNKITISGTETKFTETLITNPDKFIKAAYTNTDKGVLDRFGKSVSYQLMRLGNTKTKIARSIFVNSDSYGDEDAYYVGLKTYINTSTLSKVRECFYNARHGKNIISNAAKLIAHFLEYTIVNISASINSWGRSIVRPSFIGLAVMTGFGVYYGCGLEQPNILKGLMQGFDITFLVGYTKHASTESPIERQAVYALNAFIGLWWYAILVPTVINRLSRKS